MERTAGSTSSTEERTREPAVALGGVTLGRVVGAHGLCGVLRVRLLGDGLTNLLQIPGVLLGTGEEDTEAVAYQVTRAAPGRRGEVRLELAGVTDRDAAESLRNRWVLARSEDLAALPPGEYYQYELVGCRVFDRDGREIGTVQSIWSTGAPDVLVVEGDGGTEQLIPTAREIMQEVDIEGRRIVIDAIPGLITE